MDVHCFQEAQIILDYAFDRACPEGLADPLVKDPHLSLFADYLECKRELHDHEAL